MGRKRLGYNVRHTSFLLLTWTWWIVETKAWDLRTYSKSNPFPNLELSYFVCCTGVILNDVELILNRASTDDDYVTEKQLSTQRNIVLVNLTLAFDAQSAEFATGTDFWDVDFFLAEDEDGLRKIVDAVPGM